MTYNICKLGQKSGQERSKRSRNINLGENLEGNHLPLVCMHKIG